MVLRGLLLAFGLVAVGCTPVPKTELHHVSTVAARAPIFKMLVLASSMLPEDRRAVEDALAADLRKRGVDARASHDVFAETPKDQDAARNAILDQGYEAVLRVNLENIDRKVVTMSETDDSAEWTHVNIDVNIKTMLWDASNDQLLWSAETRTQGAATGTDLAQSISGKLLPALTRAGLILPVRAP